MACLLDFRPILVRLSSVFILLPAYCVIVSGCFKECVMVCQGGVLWLWGSCMLIC